MNKVVHFELPADDLERMKKFYAASFGWQIHDMPEMNYVVVQTTETGPDMMATTPGAINGGMMKKGLVTGPTFSIEVEDIDAATEKVKMNGAVIVKEKATIGGGMGYIVYFKDTEGNILSLWQNGRK